MNSNMFENVDDSLLVSIVGFLPFKEAGRTSVLSKRWRHIWKETKIIEFDENLFVEENADDRSKHVQRVHFFNFMNTFVENFPEAIAIEKFTLKVLDPTGFVEELRKIVLFPFSRNVQHLELDVYNDGNPPNQVPVKIFLPSSVHELMALESLKLLSCEVDLSELTKYTMLKELSLGLISISNGLITSLLTNYTLLESFSLKKCWGLECFDISIQNLKIKRLVLDGCLMDEDYVYIEGPKLEFFKYYGGAGTFYLMEQSALKVAEIDCGQEDHFAQAGHELCDLLLDLYATEDLTVSSAFLQFVPTGDNIYKLCAPINVKNLTLKTAVDDNELLGIRFMVNSCAKLEMLTIEIGPEKIFPAQEYLLTHEAICELYASDLFEVMCLKTSLKVVNVKGFSGEENEFVVLSFFIGLGRVLQQVNIYVADEGDRDFYLAIAKEVLHQLKKASLELQISIF